MTIECSTKSVTDTSTTFTPTATLFYVEIYNQAGNTVYVNFGSAATTNHFPIFVGETFKMFGSITDVRLICDTGLTATVQIIGTR
jgi:hypothetical protein